MEIFHSVNTRHFALINDRHMVPFSVHLSEDAKELYTMLYEDPMTLHVYSLKDGKWTQGKIEEENRQSITRVH
ncbi:hypothetical protein M3Y99_00148400 [Aphelenchoides fujianensis]|nr:hypothetical protein M3Y99_00148400 [Aphelenchoides fujianensis]